MAFRPGKVYLLKKRGDAKKGDVKVVAWAHVIDMFATEKRLHTHIRKMMYDSLENVGSYDWLMGGLYKVGRTGVDVESRAADVESNWKSGHTEWARLPWWMALVIVLRLWWLSVAPLVIFTIIVIVGAILHKLI